MRLWSLHPSYLDARGLVALWREGLLALKVLKGMSGGYGRHPQLERFKTQSDPVAALNCYLWSVFDDSVNRGYHFNANKLDPLSPCPQIPVTDGQLAFELSHLTKKLNKRDPARYKRVVTVKECRSHPLFKVFSGGIESWEKAG